MSDNVGKQQIKAFAERLARMEGERVAIVSGIKETRSEAKANGFNTKALNLAVKRMMMTVSEKEEADAFQMELSLYCEAVEGAEE